MNLHSTVGGPGLVQQRHGDLTIAEPIYEGFRSGDIRHSQADIGKARRLLGYEPVHDVRLGLEEALPWYEARLQRTEEMQRVDDVK